MWRAFRKDKRLTCYDEPFQNHLINLPELNSKRTTHEFLDLLRRDTSGFWNMYAPIGENEEVVESMSDTQKRYIGFLMKSSKHVVCDLTRCCFKLRELKDVVKEAYVIHLYRSPQAFASSQMVRNRTEVGGVLGLMMKVKKQIDKLRFWSMKTGYSGWGYESIIGNSKHSVFAAYLKEKGIFLEGLNGLPGYGKLMYFWKVCYEKVERDGKLYFGDRFLSLPFETFCSSPNSCMTKIYEKLGLNPAGVDYKYVNKSNSGFHPKNRRWKLMAKTVRLENIDRYPWITNFWK